MNVAIYAPFAAEQGIGGIEYYTRALLHALGELDGPETYSVIVRHDGHGWLGHGPADNQRLCPLPESPTMTSPNCLWTGLPISTGFFESLGCDVIHFPSQSYVITSMPSVFNPHDLQHRHLPRFFPPRTIAWRETVYRAGCELSSVVAVGSQWVKDDVVRQYNVHPDRVRVIPCAPPTEYTAGLDHADPEEIRTRYGLPEAFMYYPAMFWPHKNHLRLFEAMALLRDRDGLTTHLVCTGTLHDDMRGPVTECIERLGLTGQVHLLGLVPRQDVPRLYGLARFVVMPSLFEAESGPVFEAWDMGTPVACSSVTSLPQQVRDAGLLFDPCSAPDIARCVASLWRDDALRQRLAATGTRRRALFSWNKSARAYRALYRSLAGTALTAEEQHLLDNDWMAQNA
jgi:glycosyltransferase involved in cell wall biosynthesis